MLSIDTQSRAVSAPRVSQAQCHSCGLREQCLVATALNDSEDGISRGLRSSRLRLKQTEPLYWRDDGFSALFLVVSGSLKSYNVDLDGNERVRGFHFPGSLLGLDGIERGRHRCHAAALEDSVVCRMPFEQLLGLCVSVSGLQAALFRRMSRELIHAETLAGDYSAAERVATFILETAGELRDGTPVKLPMPRRDIANYLRLATETVSRIMTDFRARGLIECRGRQISIRDRDGLRVIAEPSLSN